MKKEIFATALALNALTSLVVPALSGSATAFPALRAAPGKLVGTTGSAARGRVLKLNLVRN